MPEVEAPKAEETVPSTPSEEKAETKGEDRTEFVGGKFKDPASLEEGYKNLEKKLGEQGSKLGRYAELETFEKQVTPMLEFIWQDKETLNKYRDYTAGETGTVEKTDKPQDNAAREDRRQFQEVLKAQQTQILAQFERDRGLDQLPEEDLATLRKDLGREVGELTGGQMPALDKLPSLLTKAYNLMNVEKLKEAGKLEGFVEFQKARSASISPSPATEKGSDGLPELTKKQAEVAEMSGIEPKEYAASLKKIQLEQEKGA